MWDSRIGTGFRPRGWLRLASAATPLYEERASRTAQMGAAVPRIGPKEQLTVDKVTGPLGPRRGIAAALKHLREDRRVLLADIAKELLISTSKLSRLENAQGKPSPRDIKDLIRYYQIENTPLAGRLERWVAAAQRPGWWTSFDDEVLERLDAHLAYEADATVERIYTLPFVPALLQTTEYARAIFQDMEQRPEGEIRQLLEVRRKRQEALRSREGLPALELVAVTHESALRQAVGTPHILQRQLDELIKCSEAANVRLHVLPFTTLPPFSMTCMYAYFQYDGTDSPEQDVVHIETHGGFVSIEDPQQVHRYRVAHETLVRASLDEDASRAFIRSVRDNTPSRW